MTAFESIKNYVEFTGENVTDNFIEQLLHDAKMLTLFLEYSLVSIPKDDEGLPELSQDMEWFQTKVAMEMFDKLGAEGQTGHGENGYTRSWEKGDISWSLIQYITPYANTGG